MRENRFFESIYSSNAREGVGEEFFRFSIRNLNFLI